MSKTEHRGFGSLASDRWEICGLWRSFEITEVLGLVNVGILLDESVRGTRLGKATMQVLLGLGNEIDAAVISTATIKANKPIRALATSLGFVEKEEIVDIPDRGIIADVTYKIDHTRKDFEINVEFKGPAPEEI
jgi:RimJ/RimL family protein N-acetyltransferase